MKKFYGVTTTIYDSGKIIAAITNTHESMEIPENSFTSTRRRDIYIDWFENREEAEKFVEEARFA